jgi:hypothetical protein
MSRFHCCFVGEDNRVMDFELVEAATEQDAARRAGGMLHARPAATAAELWQGGKFIARVSTMTENSLVH